MELPYKIIMLLRACLVFMVVLPMVAIAEKPATEYAVKTAMVYKLAKFVSWPESVFVLEDAPLNI